MEINSWFEIEVEWLGGERIAARELIAWTFGKC